jgi:ABC-2 type transport system permease protein
MRRSVHEIALLSERGLRRTLRSRTVIVALLFQPLLYLLIFTRVFDSVGTSRAFRSMGFDSYLDFFLPALLILAVLGPALSSGLGTVIDLHTGALDGFLRTPVRRSSILAGKLATDAVRMLIATGLMVVIGVALGASVASAPAAIAAIALACALGMAFAGLSNLVALRSRSAETTNALSNLTILPLMFCSTAYMPRALLPRWLQLAASANPLTYVIDAARRLMTQSSSIASSEVIVAAVIVVSLSALSLAAANAAFRRAIA